MSEESDNSEGFQFALTLIFTFATASYSVYNYIQNNSIGFFWARNFVIFFPLLIIVVLGLIGYIIVKAMSLETGNPTIREKLKQYASYVYNLTFVLVLNILCLIPLFFFISFFQWDGTIIMIDIQEGVALYVGLLIIIITWIYFSKLFFQIINNDHESLSWKGFLNISNPLGINQAESNTEQIHLKTIYHLGQFFLICQILVVLLLNIFGATLENFVSFEAIVHYIILLIYLSVKEGLDLFGKVSFSGKEVSRRSIIKLSVYQVIVVFLVFVLWGLTFQYLTIGEIRITMDNANNTDVANIPIDVETLGYCEDMTVNLTKTNFEENVSILDSIEVHPISDTYEVVSGKYIHSSTLDYGKYKIFIDTTNLTQGYYQLAFSEDFSTFSEAFASLKILGLIPHKTKFTSFYLTKTDG